MAEHQAYDPEKLTAGVTRKCKNHLKRGACCPVWRPSNSCDPA